jgi:hypothetical protein
MILHTTLISQGILTILMQKANFIISIDTTTIILRTSKEMHGKKQCKNMILNLHRAKNELSSMK